MVFLSASWRGSASSTSPSGFAPGCMERWTWKRPRERRSSQACRTSGPRTELRVQRWFGCGRGISSTAPCDLRRKATAAEAACVRDHEPGARGRQDDRGRQPRPHGGASRSSRRPSRRRPEAAGVAHALRPAGRAGAQRAVLEGSRTRRNPADRHPEPLPDAAGAPPIAPGSYSRRPTGQGFSRSFEPSSTWCWSTGHPSSTSATRWSSRLHQTACSWCLGARTSLATSWAKLNSKSMQPAGKSSDSSSTGPGPSENHLLVGEARTNSAMVPARGNLAEGILPRASFSISTEPRVSTPPLGPSPIAKRTTDLVLTTLLLSPRATARHHRGAGEARFAWTDLFSQERVGTRRMRRDGKTRWRLQPFRLYKFRSMIADADPSVHERHIAAVANRPGNPARPTRRRSNSDATRASPVSVGTAADEHRRAAPAHQRSPRRDESGRPAPVPRYELARYGPSTCGASPSCPASPASGRVRGRCALPFWEMVS